MWTKDPSYKVLFDRPSFKNGVRDETPLGPILS